MSLIASSFKLNLQVLKICGYFPPKNSSILYNVYGYFVFIFFATPPTFSIFFFCTNMENINIVTIADNAFLILEWICNCFKVMPFVINTVQVKKCILFLQTAPFSKPLHNSTHAKIIAHCHHICRRNSVVYFVCAYFTYFAWSFTQFSLLKERRFLIVIWLPFDAYSNDYIYYIVYFYILIGAGVITAIIVIDSLISGLAFQITGQLQILKDNLQFLDEYADNEIRDKHLSINLRDDFIFRRIIDCAKHHDSILKYVNFYESCFSMSVFSQFTGSVIVICVCCLQLIMVKAMSYDFFMIGLYLFTMLFQIYLYCYYGSTLFHESNTLKDAVYMTKWYEFDQKSQKAILLLMERFKQPITITAGKLLPVTLDTFSMVIKKAYSLLAVLQNY